MLGLAAEPFLGRECDRKALQPFVELFKPAIPSDVHVPGFGIDGSDANPAILYQFP